MYLSWLEDENSKQEFATDNAIFLGAFSNPEAAKQMMSSRNPTYELSDEDFEESTKKVLASRNTMSKNSKNEEKQIKLHRRRRNIISKE